MPILHPADFSCGAAMPGSFDLHQCVSEAYGIPTGDQLRAFTWRISLGRVLILILGYRQPSPSATLQQIYHKIINVNSLMYKILRVHLRVILPIRDVSQLLAPFLRCPRKHLVLRSPGPVTTQLFTTVCIGIPTTKHGMQLWRHVRIGIVVVIPCATNAPLVWVLGLAWLAGSTM